MSAALVSSCPWAAVAASGDLDTSFDGDGRVATDFGRHHRRGVRDGDGAAGAGGTGVTTCP
ncbi:hypothetical protein [Streptomyces sp. NPDC056431]|uniref:hypothetical protein n=1 Tax=unclassified Streptomyces TaxID=2593676 RepID=UPI00368D1D6D